MTPSPTVAHESATTTAAGDRLLFIDWLRIAALGMLIVYHVGMYYVSWGWHVKSVNAGPLIEPLMRLSSPWRMSLLFVVSGAATALMLARRPASGGWLRERAARLLLPLLLGIAVIVPPQSWLEVVQKYGYAGSFADFMRLYFTGYGGFCDAAGRCLVLPTWNHLWFLPYLFVYTALLWALLRRWPSLPAAGGAALQRVLGGARLFWLPVVVLWLVRVLIGRHFPVTHALFDDPFAHAQYALMFGFGALAARQAALWQRIEGHRWPALVLAIAGWALWVSLPQLPLPLRAAFVSLLQWCALLAAIGFAHRHLQHDGIWRRRLGDAVFPVYLLHQTLIIGFAALLAPLALPPGPEAALLVAATVATALAVYAVVRRIRPLRRWFGLKPEMHRLHPADGGAAPVRAA